MRALLVEDDDTIAGFVERGLREAGFAVDRFADGEAGFAAAIGQPYDVAVIDLKTMSVAARHKVGKDPFGGGIINSR